MELNTIKVFNKFVPMMKNVQIDIKQKIATDTQLVYIGQHQFYGPNNETLST